MNTQTPPDFELFEVADIDHEEEFGLATAKHAVTMMQDGSAVYITAGRRPDGSGVVFMCVEWNDKAGTIHYAREVETCDPVAWANESLGFLVDDEALRSGLGFERIFGIEEGDLDHDVEVPAPAPTYEELVAFVEQCFGASITNGGTGESIYEEVIRREAEKLLVPLDRVEKKPVSMIGRDYNLVLHVLEARHPWAIEHLHNRDLWAVRQELPTADLGAFGSPYYTRLLRIAEGRREAQEAAST